MTHASVFSGIGGPEVAAAMLGWDNLFHCEINPFGRKILDFWFPDSKSYEDITQTDFSEWGGRIDVLTGGFPCQPFSYAGQRRGAQDDRYLWPYMFKCIDQVHPNWVVCENVAGILTMVEQGKVSALASQATLFSQGDGVSRYQLKETFTMQRICDDLEQHGYEVQPILIPACSVGAPHRRDRVFIIGHRIAPNTNLSNDMRGSREDEGTRSKERLQERYKVRESHLAGEIRSESQGNAHSADTLGERLERQNQPRCSERGQRLHIRRDATRCGGEDVQGHTTNTVNKRLQRGNNCGAERYGQGEAGRIGQLGEILGREWDYRKYRVGDRWRKFPTVSPIHRGNDGIPFDVDSLSISFGKWRTESLKAYGNAIVPQVMFEIFRAIERVEKRKNR